MNIRKVRRPMQRVEQPYWSRLNLKAYGADNLYPNKIADIVRSSSTGASCVDRYARFIEGNGFADEVLADMVVSRNGATANDVLSRCAADIAMYGGAAIHVNYNAYGQIVEMQHLPFERCRLEESDDLGNVGRIAICTDWSGRTTKGGKTIKADERNVNFFDSFAPMYATEQMARCGGIDRYKGQILYISTAGHNAYPTPRADRVLTDLSTDEGLSNIKYRNARCNFLTAQMVITKTDQSLDDGGDGFVEDLAQFQGDEVASNILQISVSSDEEIPQIRQFETKNFDKDFAVTDASVVERIYCAYEQEPFLAIRNGKLGFSGSVVRDAYSYYASLVSKEQRLLSRAFASVLRFWATQVTENTDIDPLTFKAMEDNA